MDSEICDKNSSAVVQCRAILVYALLGYNSSYRDHCFDTV